jgi:mannitol-1-/sugar-/sorbitol-6-/2-deoxyglucose-6-phosphatase
MKIDLTNFDAVIFDMDGVLIDSEPLWKIAMEEVFRSIGSELTRQDFQKTVGLRLDEVITFWHQHEGWKNVTPKEVEQQIVLKMVELIRANATPLEGVLETLAFLKERNMKIGLATSSYEILIHTVLRELNITSFFEVTHSAEHEAYGKPHPAVYLTVAERLAVSSARCLVIEDSLNGIISGKAAKMKVVCIPEKTHFPEPKLMLADFQFDTMSDFLEDISSIVQ